MDKIERIYSKPFININTVYYNWHVKSHNTGWDLGEKSIQFHASYFYLQWNYNSEQTLVYRLALRLFGETPFLGIQDLLMVCGSTFMLWLLKKMTHKVPAVVEDTAFWWVFITTLWSTETVRIVTCQPYFGEEGRRGRGHDMTEGTLFCPEINFFLPSQKLLPDTYFVPPYHFHLPLYIT